ncbi:hypothetical protein Y032_0005g2761 [Ancylostoma ceylanicum]|uniref:Uncharacterized protein n=1 Tax=Ancylostoma ceylanicum TaxID=53326 RepID=A0A016VTA7_9BILA|nr:hypothetical protein Y032_0005g2761 [Ancylostoma ceylanicum]
METPLAPPPIQNRQGKKHKIDCSPQPADGDFDRAVNLVLNDASLPTHLRTVVSHLLEIKEQFSLVVARNRELMLENEEIRNKSCDLLKENNSLRSEIDSLKLTLSQSLKPPPPPSPPRSLGSGNTPASSFEECERKRSVVMAGVFESDAPLSSTRVSRDITCVRQIFDFLCIDAQPSCVYRMGRYDSKRPRLLKVVLPSSYFASLLLKRAPKLKSFAMRGIFIRPSLPQAERDRLRAQRLLRSNFNNGTVSHSSVIVSQATQDPQITTPSRSLTSDTRDPLGSDDVPMQTPHSGNM